MDSRAHRLRRETGVSREFGLGPPGAFPLLSKRNTEPRIGRKLVHLGCLGAEKPVGSWYGVS